MKKLLVTAIGAAAAFGAIAGEISTQRIKDITDTGPITVDGLNTVLGNYWSEPAGATNTYAVSTLSSIGMITPPIDTNPGKALDVKTTFGKPLSVNIVSGGSTNIPNSGIYFDSLVKFTVCEDTPTETYDGAKIIMWLQEQYDGSDNVTGTNLMVRAGYLSYNEGAFPPVSVTPTNYVCTFGKPMTGDFADQWHRVTIKAIPDITTGSGVPGFAIYIDGSGANPLADVNSTQAKWDSSFTLALNEGAKWLNDEKCLFPSMVQSGGAKGSLTSASFDGTGSITDIVFTDEPMAFAADYVAPKATVQIGAGEPTQCDSLADAVAAVVEAGLSEGDTATIRLIKGFTLDTPIVIPDTIEADLVLDFAGFVITNTIADAIITNNAPALTIKNESAAKGGIYCVDYQSELVDHVALYQNGGLAIQSGYFWGYINVNSGSQYVSTTVTGGSFLEKAFTLPAGKVWDDADADGLYAVIDYVAPTYTVKFISGEGSTTNEYTKEEGEAVVAPAPAAVEGKSFQAWNPAVVSPVVADATYTALYTNNIYTITFVIGESSSSVQKAYGSTIDSIPEIPVRPGYTGAWDDDPTGDTVTGDKTYTYTYSAETYTITYMYGANALTGLTPATYTVENAVTLPTEVNLGVTGVSFESWTNAEGTVVANWAAGAKTGNQTFYAKTSAVVSPTIFDGGDGSSFDIPVAKQEEIAAVLPSGKAMSDAVSEGSSMTYAQAYALGLLNETTGAVDELDATIELKDGKVVVNLSSAPKSAYTVTLKVYEKQSLTAAWPVSPTQTYTLDDPEATTGFTPSGSGSGFYKTEVTISNK